jgi:hypothetical protein
MGDSLGGVAVGGADRVGTLHELVVRQPPVAAAPADERGDRGHARNSSSTSPGSGKRCAVAFEKTIVPSFRTSNWLFRPAWMDASYPWSRSSAARLAARSS